MLLGRIVWKWCLNVSSWNLYFAVFPYCIIISVNDKINVCPSGDVWNRAPCRRTSMTLYGTASVPQKSSLWKLCRHWIIIYDLGHLGTYTQAYVYKRFYTVMFTYFNWNDIFYFTKLLDFFRIIKYLCVQFYLSVCFAQIYLYKYFNCVHLWYLVLTLQSPT